MNRKALAIIISVCMLLTMIPITVFAETIDQKVDFVDTGHWASDQILKWSNLGLIRGDERGFRPDDPITRGEMAAILNNLMDYQMKAVNTFSDVKGTAWYADAVLKANASGVLSGDGKGHAFPEKNITREEAATMFARAFAVDANTGKETSFKDVGDISAWARPFVFGMEAYKYIGGKGNGIFAPKANITRAEVITIVNNAVSAYYTEAGTYTTNIEPLTKGANCVTIVRAADVIIKGAEISGDLIVAEGVADGDFTLDNTKISGKMIARGGGVDSIIITGGSSVHNIRIERIDRQVRVFADDGTMVGTVVADGKDDIIIEGDVTSVIVLADNIKVTANNANVGTVTITGSNSSIILGRNTSVSTMNVNGANAIVTASHGSRVRTITVNGNGTSITGTGQVSNVNANANNVSVTTPNTDVIAGNGTQGVTAGNKDVAPGTTENTSSTNSSRRSSSKPPVAKTDQLINGDFETGDFTGWTVETSGIYPVVQDDVTKGGSMYAAHMGDGAVGMSDGYECFTSISQYISIEDDDTDPILYISYYVDGDDWEYDGVDININDQTIYQIQSEYSDGWKQLCLDLSEFAGETVNLSIVCWTNDNEVRVNYYIDDITLSYEDRSVGEPNNNTMEGAIELTGGLAQTHWIYPYDDIDYFSFEAEAGVLYSIETFNLFPDIPVAPDQLYLDSYFNPDYEEYCYMVTWLNIWDENGDFVAGSDNGMNSELNFIENGINKSDIDLVFGESGTYFIQVSHPYGYEFGIDEAVGRYDILMTEKSDAGDDYASATLLEVNSFFETYSIDTNTDMDWYKFEAEAGMTYRIGTDLFDGSNTNSDIIFTLYDSDGVSELTAGSIKIVGKLCLNELKYTIEENETYYIKVAPDETNPEFHTGIYNIAVYEDSAGDEEDFSDALSIPVNGEPQTHYINPYYDVDVFTFEVEAGKTYTIKTTNLIPNNMETVAILMNGTDYYEVSSSLQNYEEYGLNESILVYESSEAETLYVAVLNPNGFNNVKTAIGQFDILVSIAEPVSVTGISLDQESMYLQAGSNGTLIATIAPENATNKGVTWTSSDAGVATVNNDGIITAVSGGTAIISARTVDGSYEAHCTVTVTVEAEIADITAINGVLTVTLDAKPTTDPQADDFTATLSVGDSEAVPIALSGFNYDGNVTVTFTFELVEQATDEQDAEITLNYRGVEAGKASFTVPAEDKAQEAPVGLAGVAPTAVLDDGKITGTTTDMEYKLSSDTEWIQAGDPDTTGLYSGTYNVRYKAKPGFYAGEAATVIVPEYIAPQVLSVTVTPDNATVIQGHTVQLSVIVDTVGGAAETVEWVSSDTEGKVSVDNTGLVTVAADAEIGEYTITAISEDETKSDTSIITVTAAIPVTGITLSHDTLALATEGNQGVIIATIDPSDASNKNIIWTSSNETVATVIDGTVIPLSAGETTITATTADGDHTATCTVTVLETVSIAEISGVMQPIKGEIPVTSISENAQYTGTVSWNPDNNPFEAGVSYTATINLTAKEGYTFTGVEENFFILEGATSVTNAADEGSVTAIFPIAVSDAYDFDQIRNNLSADYVQMADITLSGLWIPIGSSISKFTGSFDGNNYVISGLTISRESYYDVGLFSYAEGADFLNITLEDVDVTGNIDVGGLVGYADDCNIDNCHVSGSVIGTGKNGNIGGLVGKITETMVSNCYSECNVSGVNNVGGLAGRLYDNNNVIYCYATGDVTGSDWYTGGLVGLAGGDESIIRECYATGNVTGVSGVGGLVGQVHTIIDCYALGDVTGSGERIGGLAGQNGGPIENCYSAGHVTADIPIDKYPGGMVGFYNSGYSITGCYYDKDTSGMSDNTGKGTPKTTEEMKQQATYADWDFDNTWDINEEASYPFLRWDNIK